MVGYGCRGLGDGRVWVGEMVVGPGVVEVKG